MIDSHSGCRWPVEFPHLLQTPLVLREVLQLYAVADRGQVLPQGGGLAQGDGEAWGQGSGIGLGGLGEGQVLGAAAHDRASNGQRVRVGHGWQRGQGPAGRGRGRSQGWGQGPKCGCGVGWGALLVDGQGVAVRLAQDLYVLGLLTVLLVELVSIWAESERASKRASQTDDKSFKDICREQDYSEKVREKGWEAKGT